ncbi:uncharacterized protein LOC123424989 [Hordeum vulgare subsp. vulgare]|uniref:uncharacterized protein LOC123424989 n=1 Tax=Hordeum vulgare subsp. vulgare TaxID=112509 RepID=UPI00162CEF7A|nr:uncharacterized protein LOC123424989 [Hordeum vulgare subsp. vulgare]
MAMQGAVAIHGGLPETENKKADLVGACSASPKTGNQQAEFRFLATFRARGHYSGHPTRLFHEEMSLCNKLIMQVFSVLCQDLNIIRAPGLVKHMYNSWPLILGSGASYNFLIHISCCSESISSLSP